MTFSLGSSPFNIGPRHALDEFGQSIPDKPKKLNKIILFRLLSYLQPFKIKLAISIFLTLLESGFILLIPFLIKIAIDDFILKDNMKGLMLSAFSILAAFIFSSLITMSQRYQVAQIGNKLLSTIRFDLFSHLQRIHLGYHDQNLTGVTVSKIINDVAEINELLSQGIVTIFGDVIVLIGIIITMLIMSPLLALLSFTVIPLMFLATWVFSKQARLAFRDTRSKVAAVVGDLAQDINGIRAIQAFSQEEFSQERFKKKNKENRDAFINAMSLSFMFLPAIEFLSILATAIVLWFGSRFIAVDTLTIGIVVAFLSYVSRFFQPIQELSRIYTTIQSAIASAEQIFSLLDTPLIIKDKPGAISISYIEGKIEFTDVSFKYRPDTEFIFNNLSFSVESAKTVAIVGPTGAGKTSIASLLARFYEIDSGSISIDGINIQNLTQTSLRQQVRIVTQEPFLFAATIAENISYGVPGATQSEIESAAKRANLHEWISLLPSGYNTIIHEGGINVSQGQKQLISIARAILTNPKILILDEATANIDSISEMKIQNSLQKFFMDRTVIVIAHRLSTVINADLIFVLENGKIVEQGTHLDLVALQGEYYKLYQNQFI